jgi:hypothetical protein
MEVILSPLRADPPFTPRKIAGTHFCQRLSGSQCHSAAGRIKPIEKSNYPIGNQTRDRTIWLRPPIAWIANRIRHRSEGLDFMFKRRPVLQIYASSWWRPMRLESGVKLFDHPSDSSLSACRLTWCPCLPFFFFSVLLPVFVLLDFV